VIEPISRCRPGGDARPATGGESHTTSFAVPLRPGVFRLQVRTLLPSDGGLAPIPMQGPQAISGALTPAAAMSRNAPVSKLVGMICREPGDSVRVFR
jgi:hypothetical protein